jgi:hypothetical protein
LFRTQYVSFGYLTYLGINHRKSSDAKRQQTKAKEESKASESSARTKVSPLQDLSLNTGLSRPLVQQPPPSTPPEIKSTIVTTSGATENKFGCVQLGAAELAMEITFYQKPHFEVWDMPDRCVIFKPVNNFPLIQSFPPVALTFTGPPRSI